MQDKPSFLDVSRGISFRQGRFGFVVLQRLVVQRATENKQKHTRTHTEPKPKALRAKGAVAFGKGPKEFHWRAPCFIVTELPSKLLSLGLDVILSDQADQ